MSRRSDTDTGTAPCVSSWGSHSQASGVLLPAEPSQGSGAAVMAGPGAAALAPRVWLAEPSHSTCAPCYCRTAANGVATEPHGLLKLLWASCSPGATEHSPGATDHSPGAMDGIRGTGTRPIPGGWFCPCLSSTRRLQGHCGLSGGHCGLSGSRLCCHSLEILFKCHCSLPMSPWCGCPQDPLPEVG